VRKIPATTPKNVSGDWGGENQAAASKPIFVQMFAGEKCLLYVIMLHHLKRTQKMVSPVDLHGKRAAVVLLLESGTAVAQYVKHVYAVWRDLGTANPVHKVLT
jgi:hypothetical protein